jgi:hypothetical protein
MRREVGGRLDQYVRRRGARGAQPELALQLWRRQHRRALARELLDGFIVNVVKPSRHAEELRLRWKDAEDLVCARQTSKSAVDRAPGRERR